MENSSNTQIYYYIIIALKLPTSRYQRFAISHSHQTFTRHEFSFPKKVKFPSYINPPLPPNINLKDNHSSEYFTGLKHITPENLKDKKKKLNPNNRKKTKRKKGAERWVHKKKHNQIPTFTARQRQGRYRRQLRPS